MTPACHAALGVGTPGLPTRHAALGVGTLGLPTRHAALGGPDPGTPCPPCRPCTNHTSNLHEIFCTCYPWLCLGPLITMRYVVYFSSFVDDVMFACNRPCGTWLMEHILKVTYQGAALGEV